MKQCVKPKRLKDLITLLGALGNLQERLLDLAQSKIDAMKRADVPALRRLSDQEQALAKRLTDSNGLRCQLMDSIGAELGMPAPSARALSVSQLAKRLSGPGRMNLLATADRLRKAVSRTAQVNRVAGASAREILNHLKWVFGAVRPADAKPLGYSGDGSPVGSRETLIFETVG